MRWGATTPLWTTCARRCASAPRARRCVRAALLAVLRRDPGWLRRRVGWDLWCCSTLLPTSGAALLLNLLSHHPVLPNCLPQDIIREKLAEAKQGQHQASQGTVLAGFGTLQGIGTSIINQGHANLQQLLLACCSQCAWRPCLARPCQAGVVIEEVTEPASADTELPAVAVPAVAPAAKQQREGLAESDADEDVLPLEEEAAVPAPVPAAAAAPTAAATAASLPPFGGMGVPPGMDPEKMRQASEMMKVSWQLSWLGELAPGWLWGCRPVAGRRLDCCLSCGLLFRGAWCAGCLVCVVPRLHPPPCPLMPLCAHHCCRALLTPLPLHRPPTAAAAEQP